MTTRNEAFAKLGQGHQLDDECKRIIAEEWGFKKVVLCKDCKHWRKFGKDMICEAVCADPYEAWSSEANDYCSLGERKEGEQDGKYEKAAE